MYSPKIKEDLIPILYRIGKAEGKTMTKIVDELLRKQLTRRKRNVIKTNRQSLEKDR